MLLGCFRDEGCGKKREPMGRRSGGTTGTTIGWSPKDKVRRKPSNDCFSSEQGAQACRSRAVPLTGTIGHRERFGEVNESTGGTSAAAGSALPWETTK